MKKQSTKKKQLTKDQKEKISIILSYYRACEVLWDKTKKESADLACEMIEDIILNN